VRARVREYMNPPPCVSACESKFVCPTCRLESVCVCVCVCVCVSALSNLYERKRGCVHSPQYDRMRVSGLSPLCERVIGSVSAFSIPCESDEESVFSPFCVRE